MFNTKVYRLSLSTGCTCPNRDGKAGNGGCTFCSADGSGEFAVKFKAIDKQIEEAKKRVDGKFPKSVAESERKYIAYFQSYTNTYGDAGKLKKIFESAAVREDIVALSIGTRPDCLEDDKIKIINDLNKIKPVWIELGLQTIHEKTAQRINRGYSLPVFEKAYYSLKKIGIQVIVHIILGLPDETKEDMLDTVRYLSGLQPAVDGIKLHLLNILKGTALACEFEKNPFRLMTLEEYAKLITECIKILPEKTVIHRMTGDGRKDMLIAPKWIADKKRVLNTINKYIREESR